MIYYTIRGYTLQKLSTSQYSEVSLRGGSLQERVSPSSSCPSPTRAGVGEEASFARGHRRRRRRPASPQLKVECPPHCQKRARKRPRRHGVGRIKMSSSFISKKQDLKQERHSSGAGMSASLCKETTATVHALAIHTLIKVWCCVSTLRATAYAAVRWIRACVAQYKVV